MDYEKLHKDTINRLQQMVSCGKITVEVARGICADFIPESEDEKIRKVIYGWICTQPPQLFDNGFSKEEMLTWLEKQGEHKFSDTDNKFIRMRETKPRDISELLDRLTSVEQEFLWEHVAKIREVWELEKQGEQKPADEVKPKFKVGDKIYKNVLVDSDEQWEVEKVDEENGEYHIRNMFVVNGLCFEDQDDWELVEQKSVNKVEPKFNVGDWVVWDNKISCHIDNIYQGKESLMYTSTDVHNMTRSHSVKGFDNNAHLWTIQDAKDGDVLATLNNILIFKEFLKNDGGISYCHYDFGAGNPQFIWTEDKNWYFGKEAIIHPATKEQRDLLFQKMKESGYEWNADTKELKKIEQESTENEELTEFDKAIGVSIGTWNPKTPEQIQAVKSLSNKLLKLAKKQINNEQNPTWSEEDEKMWLSVIEYVQTYPAHRNKVVDWLKSLKDRVQPKKEWSKEDDVKINRIVTCLENLNVADNDILLEDVNWLKSIRTQNRWEPSDEQLYWIKWVAHRLPDTEKANEAEAVLEELLEQLKKLMEE